MDNFDFDNVYNLVKKMNESKNEKCLICHFPLDKEELKLNCSHQYHFDCFINVKNCPYCGKSTKKPIIKQKESNNKNNLGCNSIIKTGPKKGQICGRTNCSYHKVNL
jgi:hypothetical protein